MEKGKMHIIFTDKDKPKHKMVKLLRTYGISDFTLTYSPHWATDSGWTFEHNNASKSNCILTESWLGYTLKEVAANLFKVKSQERNGKLYLSFKQ